MGFRSDEVEAALAEAARLQLLDDRAFARLWIESRLAHHPLSRSGMRRELAEKGVPPDTIDEVLSELCPEGQDREVALRLAQERFSRLAAVDPAARARRTVSYLTRRGFSPPDALRIVRALEKARPDGNGSTGGGATEVRP
jgi:regulatory protein